MLACVCGTDDVGMLAILFEPTLASEGQTGGGEGGREMRERDRVCVSV